MHRCWWLVDRISKTQILWINLHLESLFGAIQNDPINYGYSIRCIKDAE